MARAIVHMCSEDQLRYSCWAAATVQREQNIPVHSTATREKPSPSHDAFISDRSPPSNVIEVPTMPTMLFGQYLVLISTECRGLDAEGEADSAFRSP